MLLQLVKHNNKSSDEDHVEKDFGIRIVQDLAQVEARILPTPVVNTVASKAETMYVMFKCIGTDI